MRMPTLRPFGEGCMSGEAIDTRTRLIRRVVGTARREGGSGNRGIPVTGEGSGLNVALQRRDLSPRRSRSGHIGTARRWRRHASHPTARHTRRSPHHNSEVNAVRRGTGIRGRHSCTRERLVRNRRQPTLSPAPRRFPSTIASRPDANRHFIDAFMGGARKQEREACTYDTGSLPRCRPLVMST
jgi:hypothetical protein